MNPNEMVQSLKDNNYHNMVLDCRRYRDMIDKSLYWIENNIEELKVDDDNFSKMLLEWQNMVDTLKEFCGDN